jgi:hypothetical protein
LGIFTELELDGLNAVEHPIELPRIVQVKESDAIAIVAKGTLVRNTVVNARVGAVLSTNA